MEGLLGGSCREEHDEGVEGHSRSPLVGLAEKLLELLCRLNEGVMLREKEELGCEDEGVAQKRGILVGEGVRQNMLELAEGDGGLEEA